MESLLLKAAQLHEEGLILCFPIDNTGQPIIEKAYAALQPREPEDIALILNPAAFNPFIDNEDLPCNEEGEPIFWSWVRFC